MKNRIYFGAGLVLLVVAGLTFQNWFPWLAQFIGTNKDLIDGLSGLIQLVIWLGGALMFWLGWLRKPASQPSAAPAPQQQLGERSASVEGDNNLVITGDYNKIVKPEPEVAHKSLRDAYLTRVFDATASLALSGIDPKAASESAAQLNLGAVYTALLTLSAEDHEMLQNGKRQDVERLLERGAGRRASAMEQLNRHNRLVLLGDPGSGKSTFVNFVALCLSGTALGRKPDLDILTAPLPADENRRPGREEKPQPQPWVHDALLPVRVILRDFAARGLPPVGQKATAKTLWDFIAAELSACSLGDFAPHLRKELLEKGGLLMLDGLDEVPEAEQRRAQIKQAVEDFASVYPNCRVLVTSRTYAYQKQDWRLKDFTETVLAAFSKGQITRFVENWYAHIAILRKWNADDARGRAELLKRAIFNNDRLMGLAERPLLLTLMASLHAWRGGTLPDRREELYADTVDLLLDWWESPKVVRNASGEVINQQPSLAEWLKVDRQKVRDLLNELAYKAHAAQNDPSPGSGLGPTGTADIPEGDLVSGLMRISKNPNVNPAQLVEYLSARAGLLLPRGNGVHTFPHRTFQEYLAACYLADHGYPDEVARLARTDPNRWREVTLLTAAKTSRGGAFALWPLVDALCSADPAENSPEADFWGALLAAQAVSEIANLEQVNDANRKKLERLQGWQVHILQSGKLPAIERVRAGNTLSQLGDLRFDPERWYLPKEQNLGFVHIPAGKFIMGSKESQYDDEKPQHELNLPEYWLAKYPVTVAQYRAFVDASGYKTTDKNSLNGVANHPVIYVTWYDALEYCKWLNKQLSVISKQFSGSEDPFWQRLASGSLTVILPSEAEWEKAARGPSTGSGDGRIYPWGNEPDPNKANYDETGIGDTSPVGAFPGGQSPYGLLDMSGNTWEWTRSLWGKDFSKPDYKYPYQPGEKYEDMNAARDVFRILRGGSYALAVDDVRCASRGWDLPDLRLMYLGFRVGLFFSRASH